MNQLCFLTALTSSEWAAWVQAIGSILAICGAVGVAILQSRWQHRSSMTTLKAERSFARLETARALQELSTGALRLLRHSNTAFPDQQSIHDTAEGQKFFDFGELQVIEKYVQAIPLHTLPHDLVRLMMSLGSYIRQFRENLEFAMQRHDKMTAAEFDTLFSSLSSITEGLDLTCTKITTTVERAEHEACNL